MHSGLSAECRVRGADLGDYHVTRIFAVVNQLNAGFNAGVCLSLIGHAKTPQRNASASLLEIRQFFPEPALVQGQLNHPNAPRDDQSDACCSQMLTGCRVPVPGQPMTLESPAPDVPLVDRRIKKPPTHPHGPFRASDPRLFDRDTM